MGTTYGIVIVDPGADSGLHDLESKIEARLEQLENAASTYRNTSEISRFNRNRSTDWIAVSDEFCNMVSDALSIARETGGAFDITVGPLDDLWGFGPIDIVGVPPSDDDIDLARRRWDSPSCAPIAINLRCANCCRTCRLTCLAGQRVTRSINWLN